MAISFTCGECGAVARGRKLQRLDAVHHEFDEQRTEFDAGHYKAQCSALRQSLAQPGQEC